MPFRLLCNMLDGMLAVEGGLKTPSGELYNELPDRLADLLILVGAGYAIVVPWGPELGWAAAADGALTAYVRTLGVAAGASQHFVGPMAKPRRMHVLIAACLLSAVETVVGWPEGRVLVGRADPHHRRGRRDDAEAAEAIVADSGGGVTGSSPRAWRHWRAWPAAPASAASTPVRVRVSASSSPTTPAISTSSCSGRCCPKTLALAPGRSPPGTIGRRVDFASTWQRGYSEPSWSTARGNLGQLRSQIDQMIEALDAGEFVDHLSGRHTRHRWRSGRSRVGSTILHGSGPMSTWFPFISTIFIASCRKASSCPYRNSVASASVSRCTC